VVAKLSSPLRVGWVGSGFVGQCAHLENVIAFNGVNIVALAELRPELREKVATSFGISKTYSSHLDLLESERCDAIIAVVNRRHTFEVARDILNAGVNLLTEKPMAQTSAAASELVEIATRKNLIYSVGFMRRYDEGVRKGREIIHEFLKTKEIGEIISVRMFVEAGSDYCGIRQRITTTEDKKPTSDISIAPHWLDPSLRLDYEQFVNVCGHDINLLRYLFPEVPRISAVEYRPGNFSYILLRYSKFSGVFEWGFRKADVDGWRECVEVRFENGQVNIQLPPAFLRNVSAKVVVRRESVGVIKPSSQLAIHSGYTWAFENSDRAFLAGVRNGTQTENSGADSIKDFELIDEIWRVIVQSDTLQ